MFMYLWSFLFSISIYTYKFTLWITYRCVYIYIWDIIMRTSKQASQQQKRQPKKHIVNICRIKAENPSNIFHKNPTHSERRMDDFFLLILLFEGFFSWWWGFFLVVVLFLLRGAHNLWVRKDNTNFSINWWMWKLLKLYAKFTFR